MQEEIRKLRRDVKEIKKEVVFKNPSHFSWQHLAASFFGALILGQTFVLKGLLYQVSYSLTKWHLMAILLTMLIILSLEIYYVSYRRVYKKTVRPFGQFWVKRMATYLFLAFFVSFGLIFLYNLNTTLINTVKLIIAMSFPCAIGASLAGLLEKY